MTRIPGPHIRRWAPPDEQAAPFPFEVVPDGVIEVPDVTAGMVKTLTRQNVPIGSARVNRNARIRDDWNGIRPGTAEFGGTKPDSNPVLALITFVTEAGDIHVCRITKSSFHVVEPDLSGWLSFSILDKNGSATSFIGIDTHVTVTSFFDNLYIADGVNPIWEVDFLAKTVKEIDGAPRSNYIMTLGERLVVGNVGLTIGGWRPATYMWSGNGDPLDWTGETSGFEDLGYSNIGDAISGMFSFGDQGIVLRNRSITHLSRQALSVQPFRAQEIVGGLGCDLPFSADKTPSGIIFADQRTRQVYHYSPGSLPQPIAGQIDRDLLTDITRLKFAQGSVDPYEREYHLGIVPAGGTYINKVWVLALEKGAWTYDDTPAVSCIGTVLLPGASTQIDDLVGNIDAQNPSPTGAIDDYASAQGFVPTLFKGVATGEVIKQSYAATTDWNSVAFNYEFVSPNLGSVSRERTLKEVNLGIYPGSGGSYSIAHSKDESTYVNTKSGTLVTTDQLIRLPQLLTGKDLYWKLLTASPGFKMRTWFARILERSLIK